MREAGRRREARVVIATWLVAASATILFALGTLHLAYTFRGPKLRPRDPALEQRMREVHPGITRGTTMWSAWVGFNASHSLGAMLFGAVYGHLALVRPDVLFGSPFLLGTGFAMLAAFAVLGRLYWFRAPLAGISFALVLYVAGVAAALA